MKTVKNRAFRNCEFVCISLLFFIFLNFKPAAGKELSPEAEKMKGYVSFLASDEMKGRFPGTPENYKAAEFIMQNFQKFGVQPVSGSFFQEFNFTVGLKLTDKNNVTVSTLLERPGLPKDMWKPVSKKMVAGEDWMPLRFSENGTITGDIAFVGYGVTSKDLNYDDYLGMDVKGKIVIILSDSLENPAKEGRYNAMYNLSRFGDMNDIKYKVSNARDHGAIGVIFVKRLSDSSNTFYKLNVERSYKNSGMIVIQSNRTKIASYFPKTHNLYPVELEMIKTKQPKSFQIPDVKISITVELDKDERKIPNVTGFVKGTEKPDEYIVVGAHFDHLGMGEFNSNYRGKTPQIHNGADDNASGVSGLLELAENIAKKPLKRSVLFCSFNSEEMGVLGSSYFVNNPLIPIDKIVAMLNLDMIGRLKDDKIYMFGTGSSSKFSGLVDSLSIVDTVIVSKASEAYAPSDHAPFYAAKVPVLFAFTGVHTDYHTPTDDVEKINFEGIVHVAKYCESILRTIGNADAKPDYIYTGSSSNEKPPEGYGKGYGSVWFGIVPTFEDNPDGFKIMGTSAGSPAEKAGLKNGDVITKFGEKSIKNLHDLTNCLKEHKAGDVVTVLYLREGKEKSADVKLVAK